MISTQLQNKRRLIDGKFIVGIDPAKAKHQAAVIDPAGDPVAKSFSFDVTSQGYTTVLWQKLLQIVPNCNPDTTDFAIETSCNLWNTLASYLHNEGYRVLLVSPLTTYHSRPIVNHDFSRTDPKDAFLVASNARQEYFDLYERFSAQSKALHRLSITYSKLRKNLAQNRARLRATVEEVFPEFLSSISLNTQTGLYLLKKYLFPDDFLTLDIDRETAAIIAISRNQYNRQTLLDLQEAARHTIGIPKSSEDRLAERLSINSWIALIETISSQMDAVFSELKNLAERLPEYDILRSLKGISDITAALFLGELRDINRFSHFKQIEKRAGYNLRLSQSGQYVGTRHIAHIGNRRLAWVLYTMTEETAKWVPEVRAKYLRRQIKRRRHRKNVVASTPQLLKLIMALVKERRRYELRQDKVTEVRKLEAQYADIKGRSKQAKLSRNKMPVPQHAA
ncbi:MAG TPA: transposase [Candidatus Kryptobacter bacterium]|nr:transposase [Candidatus Kryptobacter bacterium]